MSKFRKILSVILCVCMVFSMCAIGASAEKETDAAAVSGKEALAEIDFDVPVVFIEGIGGEFFSGGSTPDESDDKQIWGPSADVIVDVIFKNIGKLLWLLLINDYDAISELMGEVTDTLFGEFSCDENGVPSPDTYKNGERDYELLEGRNGFDNSYYFLYDWRLDMKTIAAQLDEYIEYVMELTSSDKVALVAMSMGNCVLTTYLYEYYYTAENYAKRNHIDAVVYLAGAMNGVAACEDPFSGNISVDSVSLMRFLKEILNGNGLYKFLEVLYVLGAFEPLVSYVDNLTQELLAHGFNDAVGSNLATIPGFYALMGTERYEDAKAYFFDTAEKQQKYAKLIEKNDYYHYSVQANGVNMIQSLLDDGINTIIIAQYGYTMAPVTSDNDRMSDGVIMTERESYGATCAEVDGTLGDNYKQAKKCVCGKNHISPDNQIDASTCAFPDITWFIKNAHHSEDDDLLSDFIDLAIYGEEQMTVWTYEDYPQFLLAEDEDTLVPLTSENAGEVVAFEDAIFTAEIKAKFKDLF